jgi:programmed cell death protein 5
MSDLDEIRQKRMRELMSQRQPSMQEAYQEQMRAQEVESQIRHIMRQIMSPEAQQRMSNIRLAKPEFARQVEILLIQLYQAGRLKSLNDAQLKELLGKISSGKHDSKITFR